MRYNRFIENKLLENYWSYFMRVLKAILVGVVAALIVAVFKILLLLLVQS